MKQDLRYAVRTLRKSPAFVSIAVLTLGLGIGANVAIFTLVNAVLLRPLPFYEPHRLVRVFDDLSGASARDVGMSVPEFGDLEQRSGVFERISATVPLSSAFSGGDRVERIQMLATSPNYFELLGATPALGRVYGQADWVPGVVDGVVISDGLWKRQFGGDPHVIGRRIRVDEDGYTIIGVLHPEFRHPGPTLHGDVELWEAAGLLADPFPSPPIRSFRMLSGAIARLKRGLTLEQAQHRLNAFVSEARHMFPNEYPDKQRWTVRLEPAQASLTGNVRPMLLVLLAAVTFVLLMVCVNIAILLIARSSARAREYAIRQALGASRGRLVRQALTESVLISLTGGAAAIVALQAVGKSLFGIMPADMPRLTEVHSDWRMAAVAIALSIMTGVLCGITPALHASTMDPNRDLKEGGRIGSGQSARQNRARGALVMLEVALSVVVLIGDGLLIRSLSAMLQQQTGFQPEDLIVAQIWVPVPNNPNANRYLRGPERATLARELLRRVAALPGVERAAIGRSNAVPFLGEFANPLSFSFLDENAAQQGGYAVEFVPVSPGYFEVLKATFKRGRPFTDHDSAASQSVVIVNDAFAHKFSPGRDLIGRRLRDSAGRESEVVGVVGDVRDEGLDRLPQPHIYTSIYQTPTYALAALLRTRSNPGMLKEQLTRSIHGVDPELPVFGVRTMDELMSASMARRRFTLFLMSTFAFLALLLAALGIYGVMAFIVSERVQEFGIRSALGAQRRDILVLACRPGLALAGTGVVVGLGVALAVTRLMSSLLFGVSVNDPVIFATVPLLLMIVAVGACFIPAWRATTVSPMQTLKN